MVRERTVYATGDVRITTFAASFAGNRVPLGEIRGARLVEDRCSGVEGLWLAAHVFVAAAILFLLPVLADYWAPKFLLAVVLLGGVGLSAIQDARTLPNKTVYKLVLDTVSGERMVHIAVSRERAERIAEAIRLAHLTARSEERRSLSGVVDEYDDWESWPVLTEPARRSAPAPTSGEPALVTAA